MEKKFKTLQMNIYKMELIKFLINLERSNIVNSIGASILIEIIEQLQDTDGVLAFCELVPIIEKTFKIMGLTKYCESYETQEIAISKM